MINISITIQMKAKINLINSVIKKEFLFNCHYSFLYLMTFFNDRLITKIVVELN